MGMGQRGPDTGVGEGECRQEISYFMGIGKELVAIEDPGNAIGNHRASQERRVKFGTTAFSKRSKDIRSLPTKFFCKNTKDEKKPHPHKYLLKKKTTKNPY